jgi:hypothetical protein
MKRAHSRTSLLTILSLLVAAFPASGRSAVSPGGADSRVQADPGSSETVFGPTTYTRLAGGPQNFATAFDHCGSTACRIVVVNGDANGTGRISSARITLNGSQVVGPSDFNQQVSQIVRPVVLSDHNQLLVSLGSNPGGFVTVEVQCAASPVILSAVAPGAYLDDPTTLLAALQLENTGSVTAQDVRVESIVLPGGTVLSPADFPLLLGTIVPQSAAVVSASFSGTFPQEASLPMTIAGTYTAEGATFCFDLGVDLFVPPAAPGSAGTSITTAVLAHVSGAPFPPRPSLDVELIGPPRRTLPLGPFVDGPVTPTATTTSPAPMKTLESRVASAPLEFERNTGLGIAVDERAASPSGASGGGLVFAVAGTHFHRSTVMDASFSTDGGLTWTHQDPTTLFPDDATGYLAAGVVQYVPSIDRFIWLIQGYGLNDTGVAYGGGFRLAFASPTELIASGGTAWTYCTLPPEDYGFPTLTFPDLAVGESYLYLGGHGGKNCDDLSCSRSLVARTSLAGIAAGVAGGSITIEYLRAAGTVSLTQSPGPEVMWGQLMSDSKIRISSWPDASHSYSWRDVGIMTFASKPSQMVSITPDGKNWLSDQRPFLLGSTRSYNEVWFAWDAGSDAVFPQPHVRMAAFDHDHNFQVIRQVQIWNPHLAFAYASLATNICTGEIGLSLASGGGDALGRQFPNHVIGVWGDFEVRTTTSSTRSADGYGNYVTIRPQPGTPTNAGSLFDAFGYGLGATTDVRYVVFGRPASACLPIPAPDLARQPHPTRPPSLASAADPGIEAVGDAQVRLCRDVTGSLLGVSFAQSVSGPVQLSVFDVRGRLVQRLTRDFPAGRNTLYWDGSTISGAASNGIYLFQLEAGGAGYSLKGVWVR